MTKKQLIAYTEAEMNRYCDRCRFWVQYEDGIGWCQRHAPKPLVVATKPEGKLSSTSYALWPVTTDCDRCGDFQPGLVAR
jgi:hypothetical protein